MKTNSWRTARRAAAAGAIAATLSWAAFGIAQENQPSGKQPGQYSAQQHGTAGAMSAEQAAALVKNSKKSLSDSISLAEKQCGGKAIRAECCYRGASARGGEGGSSGRVCVVTLVAGDNRLIEATIDTDAGKVIAQNDLQSFRSSGMAGMGGMKDSAGFAMASRWQKATDLRGKKVTNDKAEDLGRIEDIVTDANSGRIQYAVLSFGGILGLGDKYFAIPWPSLELSGDSKAFVLNVDKDRLQNAEGFPKDHWPNFADPQFATRTYEYYNQEPYWQHASDTSTPAAESTGGQDRDSDRQHWNQPMTAWQKTSDLVGKEVRTAQTDDVGKLSDLAIDPDNGRILYGVLSFRGKLFAIPWSALSLSSDAKHLVLNGNKDQLTDEVAFSKDNWPNLADEGWARQVYRHYNVQPYWTPGRPPAELDGAQTNR
jgi:sporulation protein YlmC with PRC-barrel domain